MPEPRKRKSTRAGQPAAFPSRVQEEFRRYKERMAAHPPHAGDAYGPSYGPIPAGAGPGWAFPPSVMALPQAFAAAPGFAPPGAAWPEGGSVGQRLGTTLRMSLDLLNAGLAGGARLVGGLSGIGYGIGALALPAHHGSCGCHGEHGGCGCEACCGYDCCCLLGQGCCCRPSVGTCC